MNESNSSVHITNSHRIKKGLRIDSNLAFRFIPFGTVFGNINDAQKKISVPYRNKEPN